MQGLPNHICGYTYLRDRLGHSVPQIPPESRRIVPWSRTASEPSVNCGHTQSNLPVEPVAKTSPSQVRVRDGVRLCSLVYP